MQAQPDSALKGNLRTIFLDRDGVINEKMPEGSYVRSWQEFRLLPGVAEAVAELNRAGFRVIVVSNQRGIALGKYSASDVEAIHAELEKLLMASGAHVDAFYFCPHDKKECTCRKPLPGMFEQARRAFPEIRATESVMIGDSLSDIEFGQRLGMTTIFIEGNAKQRKPGAEAAAKIADRQFSALPDAVQAILNDIQEKR